MYSLWVTARYNTHDALPSFEELFSTLKGMRSRIFWRIFFLNLTQFCATLWKKLSNSLVFLRQNISGEFSSHGNTENCFFSPQTGLHNFISRITRKWKLLWSAFFPPNCRWFNFKTSEYLSILRKSIEKVKVTFMPAITLSQQVCHFSTWWISHSGTKLSISTSQWTILWLRQQCLFVERLLWGAAAASTSHLMMAF